MDSGLAPSGRPGMTLNESPARRWAPCLGENRSRSLRRPGRCAANTWRRSRGRICAAARQLVVADMQMDAPRGDVDLDLVAGLHQGKRTTDKAFRRDVQNAGAVAGAAHAGVGN